MSPQSPLVLHKGLNEMTLVLLNDVNDLCMLHLFLCAHVCINGAATIFKNWQTLFRDAETQFL